jgi:autotransporter-associated beta strand protein
VDGPGTLTVIGGAGNRLSVGQLRIVQGTGITLNPTTIPMTLASVNDYASYPNQSEINLGGKTVGNVISGNLRVTNPPGSAFTQQVRVTKSDSREWTIAGVFSSGGTLTVTGGSLTLSGTNTYNGATVIQKGTLIAGTNAPHNANGAFGRATSDINLGVANGNNGASILIAGPYNIGRKIRLLTQNIADSGSRVLTLGGNTADSSVFSGDILLGSNNNSGLGVKPSPPPAEVR